MENATPFLITIEFDGGVDLLRLAARLQIAARRHGFKPTWLVGVETLRHPSALEPLARWQREGEAEIGALLDAEAVPPLVDLGPLIEGRRPCLTDFPESVMDEKLGWFSTAVEQATGRRPTSFRAVKPSVDDRFYALLAKHGYKVDLTVVPHAKIPPADFSGYSEKAYFTPQNILEVPRSVRRRRLHPLVEDLIRLPGLLGILTRKLFPTLLCFRLRAGNRRAHRRFLQEIRRGASDHFDLRISSRDWKRGDRLVRDLERVLSAVKPHVAGLGAEEFLQRYKTEQLRKGLV